MQKSKLQFKIQNYFRLSHLLVIGHWSMVILLAGFPVFAFAQLPDPLGMNWLGLLNTIGNYILQIAMAAAVIMIIWSGILFMTAGGKEDRVTKAKTTFFWAIIGLAVVLVGMGIVRLIQDVLGGR